MTKLYLPTLCCLILGACSPDSVLNGTLTPEVTYLRNAAGEVVPVDDSTPAISEPSEDSSETDFPLPSFLEYVSTPEQEKRDFLRDLGRSIALSDVDTIHKKIELAKAQGIIKEEELDIELIHAAASKDSMELLRYFLENRNFSLVGKDTKQLLALLVRQNKLYTMSYVIEKGAKPDDSLMSTALEYGTMEMIRLLINQGITIPKESELYRQIQKQDRLAKIKLLHNNNVFLPADIAQTLLNNTSINDFNSGTIEWLTQKTKASLFEVLLAQDSLDLKIYENLKRHGLNVNQLLPNGESLLFEIFKKANEIELIQGIYEDVKNVGIRNTSGDYLFDFAIKESKDVLLYLLIEDQHTQRQTSPEKLMQIALKNSNIVAVDYFLKNNISVNFSDFDLLEDAVPHFLSRPFLVDEYITRLEQSNYFEWLKRVDRSDLLGYAVQQNNSSLIRNLIDRGINVNAPDQKDTKPLVYATQNPSIYKLLRENGAVVEASEATFIFNEALFYMSQSKAHVPESYYDIAKELLKTGADTNEYSQQYERYPWEILVGERFYTADRVRLLNLFLEYNLDTDQKNKKGLSLKQALEALEESEFNVGHQAILDRLKKEEAEL